MEWTGYLLALLFALLSLACVATVILGLPGTWLMLGLAVGLEGREVWAAPDLIGGGGQRRTVHQQEHSREPPGQETRAAEAP